MAEELLVQTDYQDDGKPPRSKKLIAICSWSWGPANSRGELYFISGSLNRKEWRLWSKPSDPDLGNFWFNSVLLRSDYCLGRREAAIRLIFESWRAEWLAYESPGPDFFVDLEGILDSKTMKDIASRAFRSE